MVSLCESLLSDKQVLASASFHALFLTPSIQPVYRQSISFNISPELQSLFSLNHCHFAYSLSSPSLYTFSDRASSSVARAVSVLLESVCRPWTLSLNPVSCLSLSFNCSNRFSIWRERNRKTGHHISHTLIRNNQRQNHFD